MAVYSITLSGQARAAGSTELTIVNPTTSGKALRVCDILIGTAGTASAASRISVIELSGTADGTGTTVTPRNLTIGGPASIATVKKDHSVNPTYPAIYPLLALAFNDMAFVRWVAIRNLEEIVIEPGRGIGFRNDAGTTALSMTVIYEE